MSDSADTFEFDGREFHYWDNPNSAGNCRRVEVPLGHLVLRRWGRGLLEIGNVLAHHSAEAEHVIVDLREPNHWHLPNFHNEDVLTYEPDEQHTAVLSISTLEHVTDPRAALHRVMSWAPHGLVTMPLGYRPDVVDPLIDDLPPDTRVRFLQRISDNNYWLEISEQMCRSLTAEQKKYDGIFPLDNVLGIWLKGQPLG